MKVIGRKINYVNLLIYILIPGFIMLVGSVIIILNKGFSLVRVLVGAIGVYASCVGIHLAIIPKDLMAVKEDSVLLLRTKQKIKISEIGEIKVKRAPNSIMLFLFGSLIIVTKSGAFYKQDYLSNPQHVARELNYLINDSSKLN